MEEKRLSMEGMTLTELLVAVAVISIVLWFGWPVLCFIWDHIGIISLTLVPIGILTVLIIVIRIKCREAEEKKSWESLVEDNQKHGMKYEIEECVNATRLEAETARERARVAVQSAESAARAARAASAEANAAAQSAVGVAKVE